MSRKNVTITYRWTRALDEYRTAEGRLVKWVKTQYSLGDGWHVAIFRTANSDIYIPIGNLHPESRATLEAMKPLPDAA